MANSSTLSRGRKPNKPHKDFPLFAHATRRWAKKVRGKLYYFGNWDDPQGALDRWLAVKDDLLAGRTPRPNGSSGPSVADLCNQFLTHKTQLVESGELAERTFQRYHATCAMVVSKFGKSRLVQDLRPDDFQLLRVDMAKRWGPVALGNEIQMIRSLFRFGYEAEIIEKPLRFGPGFKKPSAKTIRTARNANGPKMFTAEQIRCALKASTTNMRAMILLAINGALGNTDLGALTIRSLQLDTAWLDYPRAKTGIARRIPLWCETVEAIRWTLLERNAPKDPTNEALLFVGKRGESYLGRHRGYRVNQEARRVFRKARIEGRTFYDLRRTFQTVAEGSRDLVAVRHIMGHAPLSGDMSAVYRQAVSDERLKAVTDHVHSWLFNDDGEAA